MGKIIQARIYKGEKLYVGECLDLPIVTQGRTLDEVAGNLREAIDFHLEDEDPADFDLAPHASILASFELQILTHAEA